jgi:hypothetical protein
MAESNLERPSCTRTAKSFVDQTTGRTRTRQKAASGATTRTQRVAQDAGSRDDPLVLAVLIATAITHRRRLEASFE